MLKFFQKRKELLENTDPDRIFIENVRSFFNLNTTMAKFFCDMAVKEKYFKKKTGLQCPNDSCKRIIATTDHGESFKHPVHCDLCELNEEDQFEFSKDEIHIVTYYQLNR